MTANPQQAQSGLAKVNGAELFYEVSGEGRPLLLLHAGVADSRMWDDQVDALAESFQVIRFDLRGFGRSPMPSGVFSNCDDVRGLLDFLQIDKCHVLGISYGGLIALDFALLHPERVQALILAAPSVSGDSPSERIRRFWQEENAALEQGDLETATELNLRLWVDGPQRRPDQVDAAVRARVRAMQRQAFHASIPDDAEERPPAIPALDQLSALPAPVLVVIGALDLEEKLALADRLANELPQAHKVVIAGAAHMVNMEKPEQFNRAVREFLNRSPFN